MDIKIQNLKKIYNGNTVLDIDNLGVAKGELIGLVGNNGAGKTTLLRLILDLIQADDGFVESNGQKVNESETWKEYTGSYIDGRFLIDFLTPEEYFDFIADVYHIDDETLQAMLKHTTLRLRSPHRGSPPTTISRSCSERASHTTSFPRTGGA